MSRGSKTKLLWQDAKYRENMVNARKGNHYPKVSVALKEKGIKPPSRKGIKHTKESILKIKNGIRKHYLAKGSKSYHIKVLAIEGDDWTCQSCLLRDTEIMDVDHIKPKSVFPELKYNLNNLITLCPNCHKRKTLRERKNKDY